jgi:hypothetical protein
MVADRVWIFNSPPVEGVSSITQYGITWTFDAKYPSGQFINGDYWVVGPVTVTAITHPHVVGLDGSMANPIGSTTHGYDSRVGDYSSAVDVSRHLPFYMVAGTSLVSTISWVTGESGCPSEVSGIPRPSIRKGAVLTCLTSIPQTDSLRPAYAGTVKTVYRFSDINWGLLPNLSSAGISVLSFSSIQNYFKKPWIDNFINWPGADYLHPEENLPWYGRECATQVGDASLMLCLDTLTLAQKQEIALGLIQVGIDNYWLANVGGLWPCNGGIESGRKWPILFAGKMLNDATLNSVGFKTKTDIAWRFGEDDQTFHVQQSDINLVHQVGSQTPPIIDYVQGDIGLAEWGIRHYTNPEFDNKRWGADYRTDSNGVGWGGFVLAARILGQKSNWNHDALFDYQDRYMATEPDSGYRANTKPFVANMWDTYRAIY